MLVVVFCFVPLVGLLYLRDCLLWFGLVGEFFLFVGVVEYCASVLCSYVGSLLVELAVVVVVPEYG